ncbi:hypothetical protein GCM10007907_07400 [Chitinimonas prasina]|uniref:Prepilin-type N-terminal cleavage/methylation domain-containing protein n=1 Tax=Chitinimonas prasina TaxID=1434937 RepID=A0ABQ5YF18_9NEIS|nr:type II secretion system protein [Chitinimonas prasina]GLR11950.1 hypothetical protein GCM10007907_07400 [Chitinimonas prasina]
MADLHRALAPVRPASPHQPVVLGSLRQRGFTLVEILVVMVITSLVTGLLFQSMAMINRAQQGFDAQLAEMGRGGVRAEWYRQLVGGLVPDYNDGKDKFTGGAMRLSGLTTMPLSPRYGAPQAFSLVLRPDGGEMTLVYRAEETQADFEVYRWPALKATFRYQDVDGSEYDSWPPVSALKPAQLPSAITIQSVGEDAISWVAVPRGDLQDEQKPTLPFGGI